MTTLKYAPEGFSYYSVETPSIFHETLLPTDDADWKPNHKRTYDTLFDTAERHGTYIKTSAYERG